MQILCYDLLHFRTPLKLLLERDIFRRGGNIEKKCSPVTFLENRRARTVCEINQEDPDNLR
jgi:hypothetical protein